MNFRIKQLTNEDLLRFKDIRLKSLKESPFAFSDSYDDEILKNNVKKDLIIFGNPPEEFMLGAFNDENELIGFLKFKRDKRLKARHKSMLHIMYVLANYRNFGIGKQLILKVFKKASLLDGLEQIHLWVLHHENENSARYFYQKYGFVSQGTRVKNDLKIDGIYVDAEYMVKYLI